GGRSGRRGLPATPLQSHRPASPICETAPARSGASVSGSSRSILPLHGPAALLPIPSSDTQPSSAVEPLMSSYCCHQFDVNINEQDGVCRGSPEWGLGSGNV